MEEKMRPRPPTTTSAESKTIHHPSRWSSQLTTVIMTVQQVNRLINLQMGDDKSHGANLKRLGVALDVVNFYIVNLDYKAFAQASILTDKYRYARKELGALVTAANNNDNSHIVDIADVTSVVKILSDSSILKNNLHYLENKAAADAEHVKRTQFDKPELNKIAANYEYVQAKKTPRIDYKVREDLSRCRIYKQGGLELSHNDSNRFQPLRNLDNISRDRFEPQRE
uniref:uncharacterized protein LOC122606210 n=1 Tax=Erigeron canadensis TaxID=72917 RepID=UPI001CB99FF0|nr:uncharacterized protein LOC122606210 [Erigeron canadensis]